MKNLALILPLALLAACGEEPAAEPVPEQVVSPEPANTPPAPDEALFKTVFAETCEGAEPVSVAMCKRAMGSDVVSCEFGLGDDEYMRNKAQLEVNEDSTGWNLADAAAICAEHGATLADS
ncbi:hypothetical protein [Erythrobacter aureus]|uniref:hypothetical protein n=1 Tax=Erythrobacter aureus TaxID=2182384 RepID=UPI001F3CE304|nr:hypothetical protein [Erythrobacter aureus]